MNGYIMDVRTIPVVTEDGWHSSGRQVPTFELVASSPEAACKMAARIMFAAHQSIGHVSVAATRVKDDDRGAYAYAMYDQELNAL